MRCITPQVFLDLAVKNGRFKRSSESKEVMGRMRRVIPIGILMTNTACIAPVFILVALPADPADRAAGGTPAVAVLVFLHYVILFLAITLYGITVTRGVNELAKDIDQVIKQHSSKNDEEKMRALKSVR